MGQYPCPINGRNMPDFISKSKRSVTLLGVFYFIFGPTDGFNEKYRAVGRTNLAHSTLRISRDPIGALFDGNPGAAIDDQR